MIAVPDLRPEPHSNDGLDGDFRWCVDASKETVGVTAIEQRVIAEAVQRYPCATDRRIVANLLGVRSLGLSGKSFAVTAIRSIEVDLAKLGGVEVIEDVGGQLRAERDRRRRGPSWGGP